MKLYHFAASAAALLILPVICCSCTSGKDTAKPETETPEAVEVKPECTKTGSECTKSEPAPAPAPEVKPETAEPAKAEPAKAEPASEAKPEPVLVEAKKEPAPAKAAPAPEAKKPALPCEYTVKTGDNLWRISLRHYGSGAKWKQILEANKDKIKKADFLEPGTVLTIPAAK